MVYYLLSFIIGVISGIFSENIIITIFLIILILSFSIYSKKYIIIYIFIIGLFYGFFNKIQEDKVMVKFEKKGFINTRIKINSFPILRKDGKYTIQLNNIKIISDQAEKFYPGQIIDISGYYTTYNYKNNKFVYLYPSNIEIINSGCFIFRLLNKLIIFINKKISNIENREIMALLYCNILGNKEFLDFYTKESFRITGISHLLAISGLHVVIIASGLFLLLNKFLKEKYTYLLVFLFVIIYMILSGLSPSVLRAGIMFILFGVMKIFKKNVDFLEVVIYSMFIIILFNPLSSKNVGFWLSYTAVSGIYLFSQKINSLFSWTGKFISQILSATLSANIMTLPILLYNFDGISIISPLANLFIVPVYNILLYLLFIEFILVIWGLNFMRMFIEPVISSIWLYCKKVADIFSLTSISYLKIENFSILLLFLLYIIIIFVFIVIPGISYKIRKNNLANMFKLNT